MAALVVASSPSVVISGASSAVSSGSLWVLFNALQMIELIALYDLDYSPELEQFFHGFEFTMLMMPSSLVFLKYIVYYEVNDEPFSPRLKSFGFDSSYFLVLQFSLCCVLMLVLLLYTI